MSYPFMTVQPRIPGMQRRARGTRAACGYAAKHIIEAPIGAVIPGVVDVASVRRFLIDCARSYGTDGTKHARGFSLVPSTSPSRPQICQRRSTPTAQPRNAIPKNTVRDTGLDHTRAPTDAQVAALLSGLTRDPEARAWYPGTARRRGSLKGTVMISGTRARPSPDEARFVKSAPRQADQPDWSRSPDGHIELHSKISQRRVEY